MRIEGRVRARRVDARVVVVVDGRRKVDEGRARHEGIRLNIVLCLWWVGGEVEV